MNNLPSSPVKNRIKIFALLLLCLAVTIAIVFMKKSVSTPPSPDTPNTQGESDKVAVPDTSVSPSVLPEIPDTVIPSTPTDTLLGTDKRIPYEAGYEDGYTNGCDDGAIGVERAQYDESSSFATPAQRENYAHGYREGYAKGYEDGRSGKQFNI